MPVKSDPRRSSRRSFLATTGALGAALLPGVARPAPPEKSKVILSVGGRATLYYLPLTLAERLGFFRDEGLQVEVNDFPGGAKALQALIGGSADVTAGGYEHTIQMHAKGQKLQAFVLQGNVAIAVGVTRGRLPGYSGPQDLKGRRIGVTAPGSSTHMMVNHLLASAQLRPEDVSIIGVGTGATAVSAVRSGQVDVLSSIEPAVVMLERSGDLRIVHESYSPAGAKAVFGGPLPSACLYAKKSFIDENPNTVQALTNATVRALRWLQTATVDQVESVVPPEYMLGDKAAYTAALARLRPIYSPDGRIPPEGAQRFLQVTAVHDPSVRTAGGLRIEDTYTNVFVDRVPKRGS